jgi:phosphoserine phosphatase
VAVGAFFDVDGTLIARNSATLYMRHLRRTGQARRRDLAWTLYYLLRYKLGRLDIDEALQESMRFVRGRTEAATRCDADEWYERDALTGRAARRRARHRPLPRHAAGRPRRCLHGRSGPSALLRRRQGPLGAGAGGP